MSGSVRILSAMQWLVVAGWLSGLCTGCATVNPVRIEQYSLPAWLAEDTDAWHEQPTLASGITYDTQTQHFVLLADGVRQRGGRYEILIAQMKGFESDNTREVKRVELLEFLDIEDLTIAADGTIWFCDEKQQTLLQYSYPGLERIQEIRLESLVPGIEARVQMGRGLEGLTEDAEGRLITSFQSPLNSTNAFFAQVVVFVRYSPTSHDVAVFLYPVGREVKDAKIGAIAFLADESRIAVLEHGETATGESYAKVFETDLSTDYEIAAYNLFNNQVEKLQHRVLQKRELIDLRQHKIDFQKPEGLVYLPQQQMLYLTEDADEQAISRVLAIHYSALP